MIDTNYVDVFIKYFAKLMSNIHATNKIVAPVIEPPTDCFSHFIIFASLAKCEKLGKP